MNLHELIRLKGYKSIKSFVRKKDWSYDTIRSYCRKTGEGKRLPKFEQLSKLSEDLNIDLRELYQIIKGKK